MSMKERMSKKIAAGIEKGASGLARQAVGKSIVIFGYEPKIPEELKKQPWKEK